MLKWLLVPRYVGHYERRVWPYKKISLKNELDKIDSNTIFVQMGERNNLNAEMITASFGKTALIL